MTTTHTPSTLLALHDADPEGLSVIAAEMTGWVRIPEGWQARTSKTERGVNVRLHPPHYSTSLDAVAELEAGLTDEEHEEFRQHLWEIVGLPDSDPFDWSMKRNRAYLSAPAHLRLIAWVLTKQTI